MVQFVERFGKVQLLLTILAALVTTTAGGWRIYTGILDKGPVITDFRGWVDNIDNRHVYYTTRYVKRRENCKTGPIRIISANNTRGLSIGVAASSNRGSRVGRAGFTSILTFTQTLEAGVCGNLSSFFSIPARKVQYSSPIELRSR